MAGLRTKTIRSFTLMELMVAIVVLLVVMVAVGRIFSTTSKVAATGTAIGETLQQAVAIEQQLREDLSKVSSDGFFAIRHVVVPNNYYRVLYDHEDYFLVDDSQSAAALLRFDQLVFIRLGVTSPVGLTNDASGDFAGQALASLVYYGHGVSFPQLTGWEGTGNNTTISEDPNLLIAGKPEDQVITPWFQGWVNFKTHQYTGEEGTNFMDLNLDGTANGTQQLPSKWMLCRQSTGLVDDDQNNRETEEKRRYAANGLSTHSIFPSDPRFEEVYPQVVHGRVDIVSTHLGDIKQSVINEYDDFGNLTGNGRSWRMMNDANTLDQQELIASLMQWPRIEALPPSPLRTDQMLMMNGLAQGCVSFKVEWTYDEYVGAATDALGNNYPGYEYPNNYAQPWWGNAWREDPSDENSPIYFNTLDDYHDTAVSYEDWLVGNYNPQLEHVAARSIYSPTATFSIETTFSQGEGPADALIPVVATKDKAVQLHEQWTIFGYNGNEPFEINQLDFLNDGTPGFNHDWRYTPRPSAVRVTLRLLDRDSRLGIGWTYQFVVDLPEIMK